jgi:hypothetical protein
MTLHSGPFINNIEYRVPNLLNNYGDELIALGYPKETVYKPTGTPPVTSIPFPGLEI